MGAVGAVGRFVEEVAFRWASCGYVFAMRVLSPSIFPIRCGTGRPSILAVVFWLSQLDVKKNEARVTAWCNNFCDMDSMRISQFDLDKAQG